jgi:hypothetical protein
MLQNYLKVAVRNLIRNKAFSAINLLGLALGMAASLLILLWVLDELSVGRHYPNASALHRVYVRHFKSGTVTAGDGTPGPLAGELKRQFPEVVYAASFSWEEPHIMTVGGKATRQNVRYVGTDWFRLYGIPLLAGTPTTALGAPNSVAISRKLAETHFGNAAAALHKTIRLDNQADYQVTAVFENQPLHAEEQYDFLLSWPAFMARTAWAGEWGNYPVQTRIQLRPDADPAALEAKIRFFLKARTGAGGPGFEEHLFLHPETDAYLYSDFENGYPGGGRIEYVRLFVLVAVFLLLIAAINFTNLSTARSQKRAREVGVRKVVGAGRWSLLRQFLGESLLLTALALVLAVAFTQLALPLFNHVTGKGLVLPLHRLSFWTMLLGLGLLVGGVAGSYPALFLSSLHPVRVLKSAVRLGGGARVFRQGLVVFQFVLSMLLIVGTVVVHRQLNYMQAKHLGYERENLVYVPVEGALKSRYETFKQELLRMPGIGSVTQLQSPLLGFSNNVTGGITWPGKAPDDYTMFRIQAAGYDLAKTLKLRLAGRDFSPAFGSDSANYLINEAAAKHIGYAQPLGQPLTQWGRTGQIIGVLKDFHYGSLHQPIEPLVIRLERGATQQILVRTQPGQTRAALASLETVCRQLNPQVPFSYQFADAEYQKLYKSETLMGTLANGFAGLAILIACLGLLGLSAFTAEQRTKEIGIRKVLGASVMGIVTLLAADFIRLVLIALAIVAPLSWYLGQQWLENFAYKIPLGWGVVMLAGLLALGVALLTISVQTLKAALANPVDSLRSE